MSIATSKPFYLSLVLLLSLLTSTYQQTGPEVLDNPRLENAYTALQAWKDAMTSDPLNFTANWDGSDVCFYNGVYCAPALDDDSIFTVAGVDLNHAYIEGTIPEEVGLLLPDLALLHLNSNSFSGIIPQSFSKLKILYELDLSNNLFGGEVPTVLSKLKSLKFLDIRFNQFEGSIPTFLFKLKLDALFLNNNNFSSYTPTSVGNSPVSVLTMANNNLNRCFPPRIAKMKKTLDEILLSNSGLTGCLPENIGELTKTRVLDISFNDLTGKLPESMGKMKALEMLDVSYNRFYGTFPSSICGLPKLESFFYSHNYFCKEGPKCAKLQIKDDQFNCIPRRPSQRSTQECKAFYSSPPKCSSFTCATNAPRTSPPAY